MTRRDFLAATAGCLLAQPPPPTAERPTPKFLLEWGKRGSGVGELDIPIAIAIGKHDGVFVTEFRNNRVQRFTATGLWLGFTPVQAGPGGLDIDHEGNLLVAHMMLHKISVYRPDGKLLREWGGHGTREGEFDQPGGIAVARDGSIYVADQVNRRVQKFDSDGRFLLRWGRYGVGPGEFGGNIGPTNRVGGPQFIAIDAAGDVFTTEASVGRVQKFTPDGRYLLSWGDLSDTPGNFGGRKKNLPGPICVAVDRRDTVWVSATSHRVQQFTAEGQYLRGFGEEGKGPGQFVTPHGLAFDSRNNLYVCDTQNARIQKFAI